MTDLVSKEQGSGGGGVLGKMPQWVKVLAAELDDLSSISGTHMVEGDE